MLVLSEFHWESVIGQEKTVLGKGMKGCREIRPEPKDKRKCWEGNEKSLRNFDL